jgi:exodeoxyribonuclease VIII
MIDIEAMGKSADSVILTIGAQIFDPSPGVFGWQEQEIYDTVSGKFVSPSMNIRVDVDSQISKFNRTIDEDTMQWWSQQSDEAKEEAFSEENRVSLEQSLDTLISMANLCKAVWSKGPLYDIVMLEHALNQTKRKIPWKFWEVRDARTAYSLCPTLNTRLNGHVALDDCRNQIVLLQETFRILGVGAVK